MPETNRVLDVAADRVDDAGTGRGDDVAMPGEAAGRQVAEPDGMAAAPHADEIADLWGIALRPLGGDDDAGHLPQRVPPGVVDIVGMRRGVGETVAGAGGAHDVIDESRRPGIVRVLARRKDLAVLVVHAGETLVRRAHRQPLPPVVADPL